MRPPLKIASRSSTISNAFVQAILPETPVDNAHRAAVLEHFGMSDDDLRCVYCGDPATDWDHLTPLVVNRLPSGRTSGPGNMVPACAPCNQSKSGRPWATWITSRARRSPATRGIADLEDRIAVLKQFEAEFPHELFDFEQRAGAELWREYWRQRDAVLEALRDAQSIADKIQQRYRETAGPAA